MCCHLVLMAHLSLSDRQFLFLGLTTQTRQAILEKHGASLLYRLPAVVV